MELLHVIALQCFFVITFFKKFDVFIAITLTISLLAIGWFFYTKRSYLLLIVPLLLSVRMVSGIEYRHYSIGDTIKCTVTLNENKGKISKINGKLPNDKTYCIIYGLADGTYEIIGKVIKKTDKNNIINYTIEQISTKKINDNLFERHFKKKVKDLTEDAYLDFQNLYKAVILGDSKVLDQVTKDKFAYTGTSHLLALSGLHVGVIFTVILFITGKLPIARTKRYILVLACITAYYLGVKHSSSLTRAYIMIFITLCGKLFYENVDLLKALTLSFIIGAFLDPLSLGENSFKFSYFAVFAIIMIFPIIKDKFYKGRSKVIDTLLLSIVIQLFLSPIMINDFGKMPFLSFITNLVLMPIGSIYITLAFVGLLLENLYLGAIIMPITKFVYYVFIKIMDLFNNISYLTLDVNFKIPDIVVKTLYTLIFMYTFYIKFYCNNIDKDNIDTLKEKDIKAKVLHKRSKL